MMGQPEDDADEGSTLPKGSSNKGRKGSKGGGKSNGKAGGKNSTNAAGLGSVRQFAFKVLCTDPLAANVIGSKGSTRQAIEEETGCSVWISKRDEVFPAPPFRILVLHGDDTEQVLRALDSVVANLVEVAGRERDPESPLLGKEAGEFVFHIALPTLITGKLIGTRGANIQELREKTGARVFVEPEIFDGHKAGRIIGQPDNIRHALRFINNLIQEEAGSEEYGNWASIQPFGGPSTTPTKGKGGSREGPHAPEQRGKNQEGRGNHTSHDRGRRSRSRRRSSRQRSRNSRPGPRAPPSFGRLPEGPPLECMDLLARDFRDGELDRNHAVSCTLPRSHIDTLVEGGGEYIAYIERRTGTSVTISDGEIDGYSNMMITGPLLSVYTAHMAVMKTYHDKESERAAKQQQSLRVEELQAQLASLEGQLRDATQRGGPRPTIGRGRR